VDKVVTFASLLSTRVGWTPDRDVVVKSLWSAFTSGVTISCDPTLDSATFQGPEGDFSKEEQIITFPGGATWKVEGNFLLLKGQTLYCSFSAAGGIAQILVEDLSDFLAKP